MQLLLVEQQLRDEISRGEVRQHRRGADGVRRYQVERRDSFKMISLSTDADESVGDEEIPFRL